MNTQTFSPQPSKKNKEIFTSLFSKDKAKRFLSLLILVVVISSLSGFFAGAIVNKYYNLGINDFLSKLNIKIPEHPKSLPAAKKPSTSLYAPQTSQEEAVIKAVDNVSPAVVSVIITKEVPVMEEYYSQDPFGGFFGENFGFKIPQYRQKGTEKKEVGGGSGFIISKDGMILTNKHVVMDEKADYTVLTNDGKKYPAKVLAKDPVQDLALIKINEKGKSFSVVKLGDSSSLRIGQTIIAIGNALGEFRNTVSVGVISGLGRAINASGGGLVESIDDVIQTDAAINKGNSGGPLLNLKGEVVGINTATVLGAQNISFAIPVNKAKKDIEQVKNQGKITYPFLGIYYAMITPELQKKYDLSVDYGAWVGRDRKGLPTEKAIFAGSAAEKAGIKRDDIILELNGEKVNSDNSLSDIILKYNPGDKVTLKILRGDQKKNVGVVLGENK